MSVSTQPPEYKGAPLDENRGPGLGCFWVQIVLLTIFLILTPLTVTWGWDPFISGALLIFTLILLLFSGQTIIFLLRLVAADRRTRRQPLDPNAKRTVGQMEDEANAVTAPAEPTETGPPQPASPNEVEQGADADSAPVGQDRASQSRATPPAPQDDPEKPTHG